MYDDHYGLSGRPFQLTPDPKFWFDTATHRKAMAYLGYGLSQGEGFVVITGDPGAGKTTLMEHLLGQVDRERLHVVKLVSTQLQTEDLLRFVAAGLGVDGHGMVKSELLTAIERGLHATARSGRRTLLVVDEAQSLPIESLEELRMLSNFQAGGYPLLQIFLLGQPEFRERLQDRRLEQLRQRVIAMHHLDSMAADEVEPYLIHRLSVVGWRGRPRFTNDAIAAMWRWSNGVPRRVNQLASRVLLFGAIEQIDSFGAAELGAVIADLDGDTPAPAAAVDMAVPVPAYTPEPIAPIEDLLAEMRHLRGGRPLPIAPSVAAEAPPRPAPTGPVAVPDPEPAPAPAAAASDPALAQRIVELEAQLQDQDAALRRVLTLLVDWVEGEERKPDLSALRGNAA